MKKALVCTLIFCISAVIAQDNKGYRKITGVITYQEMPLSGVTIYVENSDESTLSDVDGKYSVKAKQGDIIVYKYLGFKTLKLFVEDITKVLNIEMVLKAEELEEVTVEAKKSDYNKKIKGSFGDENELTDATSTSYIKGEELSEGFSNIAEAVAALNIPGLRLVDGQLRSNRMVSINNQVDVIWDVNGIIYQSTPDFLDISFIEDIRVLKGLSETAKYGTLGAGGVIVVRTKNAVNMEKMKKEKIASKYYSNVFYNNDAKAYKDTIHYDENLLNTLKKINNKEEALKTVKDKIENKELDFHQAIEAATFFKNYYKGYSEMATILHLLKESYNTNPEILKSIGYYFQELGRKKDAISVYEQVIRLRPGYLQSYIDLANAYKDDFQYKRAWRVYLSYLNQGKDISDLEVSKLVNNEMEWLYYLHKEQAGIKGTFIPKSINITDFQDDVRLVVEWNTSDADFIIEFVNPDNRAYNFAHTLHENQDVIMSEKVIGYSSREFVIDKLGQGNWLINITYLGNKTTVPTYFKFTLYSNWGRPFQEKEVVVHKFHKQRDKIQLFKLPRNAKRLQHN